MTDRRARTLKIVAAFDVAFFAMAIFGSIYHRSWMAFGIGSVAIITFIGMFYVQRATEVRTDLRVPIATTVTLIYVLLVVTWSFYRSKGELPQLTETLMTSFTSITGIVIAFYFGSSAYVEAQRMRNKERQESSPESANKDSLKGSSSDNQA